jgi:hypothetical protein
MQTIVKIAKHGIRAIFAATWYFWFPVVPAKRGRIIFRKVRRGLLIHYCHPIVTITHQCPIQHKSICQEVEYAVLHASRFQSVRMQHSNS